VTFQNRKAFLDLYTVEVRNRFIRIRNKSFAELVTSPYEETAVMTDYADGDK